MYCYLKRSFTSFVLPDIVRNANDSAALVLGHLVYEEARHWTVWILRNYVLNLSSYNSSARVFPSNCFNKVYFDIWVHIISHFFCHSFSHCFIPSSTVAEGVIIVWAILLKVVANYRASRWDKGYWRTHSLMWDWTTVLLQDFSNRENFGACNLLDFSCIVRCKPFEISRSHSFKIDQLNQNWHFSVPGLMHYSFFIWFFNY